MNKTFLYLFIAFCIVILTAFATYYYVTSYLMKDYINNNVKGDYVCTQDAKLCPDGSYVGREGPNCEFTECPK